MRGLRYCGPPAGFLETYIYVLRIPGLSLTCAFFPLQPYHGEGKLSVSALRDGMEGWVVLAAREMEMEMEIFGLGGKEGLGGAGSVFRGEQLQMDMPGIG